MVDSATEKETIYHGKAVSPGIAIAPLHAVAVGTITPEAYNIREDQVNTEQQRLGVALHYTKKQLREMEARIRHISGEDEARIFEAHLMVLEDSSLIDKVVKSIGSRLINAEYAFYAIMQNFLEAMRRVPDPYLAERTVDLEDVCQRVLVNFSGSHSGPSHITGDLPDLQHVIIAHDLSPSDTATMDRERVVGFATELGSINSHTAILARSLGIPAIVGLADSVIALKTLTPCILDGYTGRFIVHPTEETLKKYQDIQQSKLATRQALDKGKDLESTTQDGHKIVLSANIEFNHELDAAVSSGAAGIGLYRTEFFLLNGDAMPDEQEQTDIYIEAVKAAHPHQVIFRTLDAGGDKLPAERLDEPEPNPFLGWRGIRVSLSRPDVFRLQLRAILRASAFGKVGIMFPFISGIAEVRESRKLLEECRQELIAEGVSVGTDLEVGAMIEIPSAAIIAHHIAEEVDFFSIGTNDLVQYTLAVDRVNNRVAHLYNPAHPSVIELMSIAVRAAHEGGIWSGVCGEMAGDLLMTPVLIGLGIRELSVGTHQVPLIREAIRSLKKSECEVFLKEVQKAYTSEEVNALTVAFAKENYPDLLEA